MSEIRIRFRHLHSFLTIAQQRSVGAAAQALSITQPALSKTLRELEDALGARLFSRDRKGMVLTRAGETFLQHAAASLAAMREGIDSVRQSQATGRHEVRVGALPNVSASIVPNAVRQFKRTSPEIVVRVVPGDNARLLDALRLGEIDLVVGRLAQPEYMVGLSFEHLFSESLTAVVRRGHPLAGVKRFRLAAIGEYPCVLPSHGTTIRHEIDRFLLSKGVPQPSDLIETNSIEFGHAYVQQTDAIWFTPRGYLASSVALHSFAELPVAARILEGPVGVTTRSEAKLSAAVRQMIDAIRSNAGAPMT
jgi:LysR family pca operon transcriptional activator